MRLSDRISSVAVFGLGGASTGFVVGYYLDGTFITLGGTLLGAIAGTLLGHYFFCDRNMQRV